MGFQHYLAETYSNSTMYESLDDVTLYTGVTFDFEHAYTFCIVLACVYSIGFVTSCISLPLLSCNIRRTDRPQQEAPGGIEMAEVAIS